MGNQTITVPDDTGRLASGNGRIFVTAQPVEDGSMQFLPGRQPFGTAMNTTSGASSPSRILIVDDDVALLEGVESAFGGRGRCDVLFEFRACAAVAPAGRI